MNREYIDIVKENIKILEIASEEMKIYSMGFVPRIERVIKSLNELVDKATRYMELNE